MTPWGRSRRDEVPGWAAPMAPADYGRFREHLDDGLAVYASHRVDDGVLTVLGRPGRYPLATLVASWLAVEEHRRAGLVASHLWSLFAAEDAGPAAGPEELLGRLRPRLWSSEAVRRAGATLITRPVAEDLVAVLCVDWPTAVLNLTREQARALGGDCDALWTQAIGQIDDGLPVEATEIEAGVTGFTGDSLFVASRMLDLDRFCGPLPPAGALVAAPNRQALLVHPIVRVQAIDALRAMLAVAHRLHRRGPGSIVDRVYWWRWDERPLSIPATTGPRSLFVAPPDSFIELLNTLPG